jgi:oligoribonuclease (3'-5' exoribonuclease)
MNFFFRNQIRQERTVVVAGKYLDSIRAQLKILASQFNEFCHYRSVGIDVVSVLCEKWFPDIYKQYLNRI